MIIIYSPVLAVLLLGVAAVLLLLGVGLLLLVTILLLGVCLLLLVAVLLLLVNGLLLLVSWLLLVDTEATNATEGTGAEEALKTLAWLELAAEGTVVELIGKG